MMHGKRRFRLIFAGLLFALAAAAARADVIILVDGRQIVGQIIEETPDRVTVKVPYGTFTLKRSRIVSIEKESDLKYHLRQGDHFAGRGQLEVAIGEYRKAVRLAPASKVAKDKLHAAVARLGRRYLALRRRSEARRIFEDLAKLDPGNLDARLGLGRLEKELAAVRSLVEGAGKLAAAGRYGEAAASLREALESAPEMRAELAGKLAAAYRGLAEQFYGARRYEEAAGHFARALGLKPDLAPEIESRYISSVIPGVVKALNAKDPGLAAKRLGPLMGFAPTDPRVLYLAGTVHANRGEPLAAARSFSRGLGRQFYGEATRQRVIALHDELKKSLGGRGLVLARPFSERYAESEDGDWKKLEGQRFLVYHHNEKLARLVLQSAEYYVDRVQASMQLPAEALWKGKCPIYIYRNKKEYQKASGREEWSGGSVSMRTRGGQMVSQRVSTWQTAPKLLNNVLPHELAHLAFHAALKYDKKYPLALHEGVAVYNELAFRRSFYRGVLRTHLKTDTTIPTPELLAMKTYPEKPDLFYAQGLSLVEYLMEARGAAAFLDFSRDVGRLGLAEALKKHYSFKDYAELDRYWKTYAQGKK